MQIDELILVAKEFGLPIVEDAAESLGSCVGKNTLEHLVVAES